MAVNTRLSAPNYRIFEPDTLDAIYAKGMLDPQEGGIAAALANAHTVEKGMDTDRALAEQDRFNAMARGLDAMEINQRTVGERMKIAPSLLEHGTNAGDILGIQDILTPGGIQNNDAAGLFQGKTRAEIAALNAKANADRLAGVDTVKDTYQDLGRGVTTEVTHRGRAGTIAVPTRAPIDTTGSTPVPPPSANPNAASAAQQAYGQRVIAAVGTDKPTVIVDAKSGNHVYTNPANGRVVAFDPKTGNQVR